jgi:hypothetical protein
MRSKIIGAVLALLFGAAEAATLDFTSVTCNGGQACAASTAGSVLDQTVGDIPGVLDVTHRALTSAGNGPVFENFLRFWDNGYAGLTNVAWGASGHSDYVSEIRLATTPGNTLILDSLQLGSWAGTSRSSQVTIFDGSYNVLFSSGTVTVGAAPSSFSLGLSTANGLVIQWGPDGRNVAIDNIVLSAAPVPEPQAYILLLAGLGTLLLLARRRPQAHPS